MTFPCSPCLPCHLIPPEGHGPARASHAALSVVAKLVALACATLLLVSPMGAAMPLVLRHFTYGTACMGRSFARSRAWLVRWLAVHP